ncbi:RNA polymerase sigma factor [Chitinophagaceae bacterium MMS25-I14]
MEQQQELIPHLFRTEFSKITAVLSKFFGLEHIETAEDIAAEIFLQAVETWPYKGIPANPAAWLYTVAKNKARNYLEHNDVFHRKVAQYIKSISPEAEEPDIDLSEGNITDSQLRMLFAICHPAIPAEAQIGLALRILCGFGINEIADAFLTSKETINKRLFRAKEKLRTEKVEIIFPGKAEIDTRLETVLATLYLLFSEGYYSESNDEVLRKDLCLEAMRLTHLLTAHEDTDRPPVNALLALMCFHASRFDARKSIHGTTILYEEQDAQLWDEKLIAKGIQYLSLASKGDQLSRYHIEAAIAYWHTQKTDVPGKWEKVLELYDVLLKIHFTPVAALNRIYALYRFKGREEAIKAMEQPGIIHNQFYFALLGELFKNVNPEKALISFRKALTLAKTAPERLLMQQQIDQLSAGEMI